jgi:hypothetical protein
MSKPEPLSDGNSLVLLDPLAAGPSFSLARISVTLNGEYGLEK